MNTKQLTNIFNSEIESSYKVLNDSESLENVLRAKAGCIKSRNKLINGQLKYIRKQAFSIMKKHNRDIDLVPDAISEAIIAFDSAINTFDTTLNIKFSTHVNSWISSYIGRFAKSLDTIRRPENTYWDDSEDTSGMDEYDKKLSEIEAEDKKSLRKYKMSSFDAPVDQDSPVTIMDLLVVDEKSSEDIYTAQVTVEKLISRVNGKDKKIIDFMAEYNKLYGEVPSLKVIGNKLGMSRQGVSLRLMAIRERLGKGYEI